MAHKERRAREQKQLKADIIKVAIELAESGGWSAVSIRKIADRIEYSTQKVYELFASKDDLILALIRLGITQLVEKMKGSQASINNLNEGAYAMAEAYCHFAWENKALYRIMYGLDGVPFNVEGKITEGLEVKNTAASFLRKVFPEYTEEELFDEVSIIWGTMHGIIALEMTGRFIEGHKKAGQLVRQAITALLMRAGLE